MMEYIEFTIIGKHIVCRRSGVIADNTDYMMRFAFDEGWDGYPDKTVLVLDNEGKIWELHLTGGATEIKLPKFIGRKLLAVGVTATAGDGEISTDAVSLRVNPSIRTGASEVIDSPESGVKDMLEEYRQKYDALIAELQAAIDSTYLGVTGAEVGQTVRITEVDEDGNPTGWEAVDFPEQVQGDWGKNDESQLDYVKNRTHYMTPPTPIGTLTFTATSSDTMTCTIDANNQYIFEYLHNCWGYKEKIKVTIGDTSGLLSIEGAGGGVTIINGLFGGYFFNRLSEILTATIKNNAVTLISGTTYDVKFEDLTTFGYKTLDENYIPMTIPRTLSASAGDILQVKSVDEEGKPQEWEAVDFPSGAFVVNLTMGGDGSITADKTFAEIKAAYDSGKMVTAKCFDALIPLIICESDVAYFQTTMETQTVLMECKFSDGVDVWTMAETELSTAADARSLGISSASVGQTIKIKSVDGSGKPTSWEAVDGVNSVNGQTGNVTLTARDIGAFSGKISYYWLTSDHRNDIIDILASVDSGIVKKSGSGEPDGMALPAFVVAGETDRWYRDFTVLDSAGQHWSGRGNLRDSTIERIERIYAENFTVNLTFGSDSITADKTFAEIKEAYDNGKIVMAKLGVGCVPLIGIDDSIANFQAMMDNQVAWVRCESQDGSDMWDFGFMDMATADDARSLGMSGASVGQIVKVKEVDSSGRPTKWEAATDSTPFIVEFGGMGSEDEPYTSSHTYDQIAAAVSAGRYVIGYAGLLGVGGDPAMGRYGIYFNLTSIQDMASFEFVDSYNSYRISVTVLSPSGISVYGSYLDAKSYRYGGVKADDAEETDTQPVRKGTDGKLYTSKSLGITGASAGQIIKIKSVDDSGNPTEWEAVDFTPATVKTWTEADLEETT